MTAGTDAAPVDITSCETEPIHIPSSIQPHGVLLALDPATLSIEQVSANVQYLLGLAPSELIGASPERLFGEKQFEPIADLMRARFFETGMSLVIAGPFEESMECIFSRHRDSLLMELQPTSGAHSLDLLDVSLSLQAPLARMERTSTLGQLVAVVAKEIRAISGFDRVMVYRFDEDWHGVVVAEDVGERLPVTYLGLHFPASDIPLQARTLYLLNTLRLIPDTRYTPVGIVPSQCPRLAAPLDLSRSDLRSVSPIHLEYLRNMGVSATLTISIIVRGKLWGLVACHHDSVRRLNHAVRSTCNFFAQMLALKLTARLDHTELSQRLSAGERIVKFVTHLESTRSLPDALRANWKELLPIFGADALFVRSNEGIQVYGTAVSADELRPVIERLRETAADGIASSSSLRRLQDDAERYAAE